MTKNKIMLTYKYTNNSTYMTKNKNSIKKLYYYKYRNNYTITCMMTGKYKNNITKLY